MKQTDAVEPPDVANQRAARPAAERLEFRTGRFDLFRESARGAAMSQADTLLTMPPITVRSCGSAVARSLIEVPEVKAHLGPARARPSGCRALANAGGRRAARAETAAAPRGAHRRAAPCWPWRRSSPPARSGWSGRPARVLACSIAEATAPDRVVELARRPFARRRPTGRRSRPAVPPEWSCSRSNRR